MSASSDTSATDPEERLRAILGESLPGPRDLRSAARERAAAIDIGRSAFLRKFDVASELEYKQAAMRDGRIMYHAHIGMNDMAATGQALSAIQQAMEARSMRLDRVGVAFDRRMGLPPAHRESVAAETGPMAVVADDWRVLAESAPIQPHLGDFMIGQPASVENTVQALRIGCTTIGNLSQYFTFQAPGWRDVATTTARSCEAMLLLAELRDKGVMLHSYLEDGYGALFRYCPSVIAWALLERYLVEELIGARLSHCIGGLTRDPVKRAGWVFALQRVHGGEHVGSMIYGDTLSFGPDFECNRALTAEYLLWDILAQLQVPSGHAVLPLPVTEALRIPDADEIIEAQLFGRRVEETARRLYPHFDFSAAEAFADSVYRQGRRLYQRALERLSAAGVDTRNPVQMLYVLKQLGAQAFEQWVVEADEIDAYAVTDVYALAQDVVDEHRELFADPGLRARVAGRRFIVASSDVHEHASGALAELLSAAGANVIYLGAEQDPSDLVAAAAREACDAILLSTHNGMALEYARQLRELLDHRRIDLPVIMGGVLNQKVEGEVLPVPVLEELQALGMRPAQSLPGLTRLLPHQPG